MNLLNKFLLFIVTFTLFLTGCATTNNNGNIEKEKPEETAIPTVTPNLDDEININEVPDALYDTLFKSEIILDLTVDYNSEEPRTVNQYNQKNDIAFNLMYGAQNGWPFLSVETIHPEESILIQEKSGVVYQNKFKASAIDDILKNIFSCSDNYLQLIKSDKYSQTEVAPSDGYFYDNDYYYFSSTMAGYGAILNSINIKEIEKQDDNKYKIYYEANYETDVLYDNYLYAPIKRESIVLKHSGETWSVLNSVLDAPAQH